MKKHLKLENLSLYRNEIYGISIIWIMLFHGCILPKVHLGRIPPPSFWENLLGYGNIGVDIFIFLSGISCYFSFHKNIKRDYDKFYFSRILRVLIPYLIWGSVCWFLIDLLPGKGISQFLLDLTLYSFWKNGQDLFWYVALILLLYTIFPFIYRSIFEKEEPNYLIFFLWMFTVFILNAYLKNFNINTYENIEIALCRVPVFICGTLTGYYVYLKKNFCHSFYILCFILAVSSYYICNHGNLPVLGFRYTYLVIGISICITLSVLLDMISLEAVHTFLKFFGSMSLELYIIHIALRKFFIQSPFYVEYCFKEYMILLGISIIIAFFLSRLSSNLKNCILNKATNNLP